MCYSGASAARKASMLEITGNPYIDFLMLIMAWLAVILKGSLSKSVSETRTATGSELISLLTRPHTTTFTLLS